MRCLMVERVLAASLATLLFWLPLASQVARAQEVPRLERVQGPERRPVPRPSQQEAGEGAAVTSDDREIGRRIGDALRNTQPPPKSSTVEDPASTDVAEDESGVPDESAEDAFDVQQSTLPSGPAKTAVTSQQIEVPKGEGSLQGMGESFTPNLSSGTGTFSVPIAIPKGRAGVQPSLTLSYSTSGGDGIAGIGWSVGVPFISRQTDKGLPRYRDQATWHADEDVFMYNGGQELVPVSSSFATSIDGGYVPAELAGFQQYRARVEGGFMRFFRAPDSSRWVVQSKDGTRFDFGACPPAEGASCESAVQSDPEDPSRAFSWALVRMSDVHGSTVQYRYLDDAGTLVPEAIYYTTPVSCSSMLVRSTRACVVGLHEYAHRIGFVYEPRSDTSSSYVTTWRTERTLRLKRLEVTSAAAGVGSRALVRRYHLTYDPASYHSLLTSVQVEGRPSQREHVYGVVTGVTVPESALGDAVVGELLPPMSFTYSAPNRTTAEVPGFGGINGTVKRSSFSPPHSADEGRVDFFDVNADGLPDLLVTDPARYGGGAGVFFNGFANSTPGVAGAFSSGVRVAVPSGLGEVMSLSSVNIVPMDVDGDGRADILHMPREAAYGYFVLSKDPTQRGRSYQPLEGWSFLHVSKLLPPGVTDPRIDFGKDGVAVKTLDVNNDHLIDIVRTTGSTIQTWLNLGRYPGGEGRFGSAMANGGLSTAPVESCLPFAGQNIDFSDPNVRIADMNGDGLQDIVKIAPYDVLWWPGRGEGAFGDGSRDCNETNRSTRALRMQNPPQELNVELAGLYLVDVNEDGVTDLVQVGYDDLSVWFNQGGEGFTQRLVVQGTPFFADALERVRIADIDGSTTTDLIYAEGGDYRWIDFMGGVKPRLLVGVDNGLGAFTQLTYASSVEDYLRDLGTSQTCDASALDCFTWHREPITAQDTEAGCDARILQRTGMCAHRVAGSPVLSSVVRKVSTTDRLDVLGAEPALTETEYRYHDGYYEGVEQEFRGFGAADAVAIGDTFEPTSITRTYFHQGRRPNEIASDRLADNPNEALKGREFLTEVFDESGKLFGKSHATYVVRRLIQGLNRNNVSYAYVSTTEEFRFDPWSTNQTAVTLRLPSVVRQEAREGHGLTGVLAASVQAGDAPHSVSVPGLHYAHIRNTTDFVDNVGNAIYQTAWGRGGRGEFSEVVGDERITQVAFPVRISDTGCSDSGWLWRTASSYVTDSSNSPLGHTEHEYSICGDQLAARRTATLPTVGAFDFSGSSGAQGFTQANGHELSSVAVDSWGQPREQCAGGLLSAQGTYPCLGSSTVTYDADYQDLVLEESIAVAGPVGTRSFLATSATWDRGLGVLRTATDPNGYVSEVTYDGLGRLTSTVLPSVHGCEGTRVPNVRVEYDLTSSPAGRPVSRIATTQFLSCAAYSTPDSQLLSYAYVDGLGRVRATLTEGEQDANAWEDSRPHAFTLAGRELFTKRGKPRLMYQPSFFDGSPDDYRAVLAHPVVPYKRAHYDALGRPTLSINEDNTYSSISYHALSSDLCDEVDNGFSADGGQLFRGTCITERTDGHGRVIDQQQRQVTLEGARENHRLFTYYRADGAVLRVVRMLTGDNVLRPEGTLTGTFVERRFYYDTLGRRIASEDPDTDNRAESTLARRTWRYVYNRAGALAAVRDPRGCGQNFYYDLAGRVVGEAYVSCAEAQAGELPIADVPAGSVSLDVVTSPVNVHVRNHFDAYPFWAENDLPSNANGVLGRMTAVEDRAHRSALAYDERGNAVWAGKQLAVIGEAVSLPEAPALRTDGRPRFDGSDEVPSGPSSVLYDEEHTYTRSARFDHAGRVHETTLPSGASFGEPNMPDVSGRLLYYRSGAPRQASLLLGTGTAQTVHPVVARMTYTRDGLTARLQYGDQPFTGRAPTQSQTLYDVRRRPIHMFTSRTRRVGQTPETLANVSTVVDQRLTWDGANNLVTVQDRRIGAEWPVGHKPATQHIAHDALYRVARVSYVYQTANGLDDATDWRDEEDRRRTADPMASTAARMLAAQSSQRVVDLEYSHDWLANNTEWDDDAHMFYERSIGRITNGSSVSTGASPTLRPSALYLASNLDPSTPADLGGWLETDYGAGGNLLALTVHAQCTHASAATCADPGGSELAARRSALRSGCECASEQHYVYRWDALNRLHEARRYDRSNAGAWEYAARQRYRYDSNNQRTVKQTLAVGSSEARTALYVFPGDFERRGLVVSQDGDSWEAIEETENQYLVAGARVVWKNRDPLAVNPRALDPEHRITFAVSNLIGSTSAVVDLVSGELVEAGGFYPNGARETLLGASAAVNGAAVPIEPLGFTGKEADEEVGLTYFGERYLVQRIGRWASPDPLWIHAEGGGEALNAYHYVSGNLLQARDPLGLDGVVVEDGSADNGEIRALQSDGSYQSIGTPNDGIADVTVYDDFEEHVVAGSSGSPPPATAPQIPGTAATTPNMGGHSGAGQPDVGSGTHRSEAPALGTSKGIESLTGSPGGAGESSRSSTGVGIPGPGRGLSLPGNGSGPPGGVWGGQCTSECITDAIAGLAANVASAANDAWETVTTLGAVAKTFATKGLAAMAPFLRQKTPKDAQKAFKKGQAPKEVAGIDAPEPTVPKSQWHAHQKVGGERGPALNQDGSPKDGVPSFSRRTLEWLQSYGWSGPKE